MPPKEAVELGLQQWHEQFARCQKQWLEQQAMKEKGKKKRKGPPARDNNDHTDKKKKKKEGSRKIARAKKQGSAKNRK